MANNVSFWIPRFFGDGMLFEMNKPANLWGKSTAGSTISATMYKENGFSLVSQADTVCDEQGNWRLSLDGQTGGYDSYVITIFENGIIRKVFSDIVFGALWVACGQSNMEFYLVWAVGGEEAMANASDHYMRIMLMPNDPTGFNEDHSMYVKEDIPGTYWGYGDNGDDIAHMSAIAYTVAVNLRAKLDIPVGIINSSLGATCIQTWLSREIIEKNTRMVEEMKKAGTYLPLQKEKPENNRIYNAMTAMYNTKIGPIKGYNVSGCFWYQGETNIEYQPNYYGCYTEALVGLSDCFSDNFNYPNGDMPLFVVDIVNHPYSNNPQRIPIWIEEVSNATKERENIIHIPLYDGPLTYKNPPAPEISHSIHPNNKILCGTRIAESILHNIYKVYGDDKYYAPEVISWDIVGSKINVKFKNVGTGLETLDNSKDVHGFTIGDETGKYIAATANIISKDTVEVFNRGMKNPKNFTYAFNSYSVTANLCESHKIPAISFRSSKEITKYFGPNDWMFCDKLSVFENFGDQGQDTELWHINKEHSSENDALVLDKNEHSTGTGCLKISYDCANDKKSVLVESQIKFFQMDINLQDYASIACYIKNLDDREKEIKLLVGNKESGNYIQIGKTQKISKMDDNFLLFEINDQKEVFGESFSVDKGDILGVELTDIEKGLVYIDKFELYFCNPEV